MKEGEDKLRDRGPVICTDGLGSPPDEVLDWGYTVSRVRLGIYCISSTDLECNRKIISGCGECCVLECNYLYF